MPSSSSSSAQQARQALADQLREIRLTACLSAKELAARAGWHRNSKVSKIEHGARPASADDVRAWCLVCGVPEQRTNELLAEQRSASGMWISYQRLNRAGLRRAQQSVRQTYDETSLIRAYQSRTIPGLIQTEGFTTTTLEQVRIRQGVQIDDVAEAVAERLSRQGVLREGNRRFVFLLEEAVLRYRLTDREVHVGQLRHLLAVMRLPVVSLNIIPLAAERVSARPVEGFVIFGDSQVSVELVSGYLNISQSEEVATYVREFKSLLSIAVSGDAARALIADALKSLD